MFTKSQLVAAAALIASASSVVASPFSNDVTDIEARSYSRDALVELKRRAILEYLEELEARDPTTGATSTHGRHTQHTHAHTQASGETRTTAHKQHHLGSGGRPSSSTSKKLKSGEQQTSRHEHLLKGDKEVHRVHTRPESVSASSTHRHGRGGASINSGASAAPSLKGSNVGQSGIGASKQATKRSVLEYLEDLVERAPTEATTGSGSIKGTTQSTPAGAKGPSPVSVPHKETQTQRPSTNGAHKETDSHAQHLPANVAHKGTESHPHSPSVKGTHKETESHTVRPSSKSAHKEKEGTKKRRPSLRLHRLHRHKDLEADDRKVSKHRFLRSHRLGSQSNGRRLRVYRPSYERTAILGTHKATTSHDHQRLASPHAKSSESRTQAKSTEQHPSSSNTAAGSQKNGVTTHTSASPVPAPNSQVQKQQPLKSREIEELSELIARELDLYDELD